MKRFLLAAGLCLLLPACDAQYVRETPIAEATPTPVPERVVTETFRPNEHSDPVTVTVLYNVEDGQNRVEIVQNGTDIQTIAEEDGEWMRNLESLTVEDMNFDGDMDFRFCYATFAGPNVLEHVYLYTCDYNTGSFSFEKAEELDGLTSLSFDAESKNVFSEDRSARMGGWSLLKWTEDGCALRREACWERDFDGARTTFTVRDRSPLASPFSEEGEPEDAWIELARWESRENAEPEMVLLPWQDLDYFGGENAEAPTEIPRDLLDFLAPLVAADTWRPFAQQYAAGKELSYEDAAAGWSDAEGGTADATFFNINMVWGLRVDADNDGQPDVFLHDMQGSGHYNYFYLLRGGGEVTEQGLFGSFTGPYWISWAGNRYLLAPWYDYDTGRLDRLNVWLFREGAGVRRAYIERKSGVCAVEKSWAEEGYEAVLADLSGGAAKLWIDFDGSREQIVGTAERTGEGEYTYRCDWNNDGAEETYRKFTRSGYPFVRHVALEAEGETMQFPWVVPQEGESLSLFWVDAGEQGNLVYTAVDGWGDAPVVFTVRLIKEGESCDVATLTLMPVYDASVSYEGPDCMFDWW